MIRFNNDYNHGAHASILQALAQTNDTQYGGYGVDEWCDKAEQLILELAHCPQGKVWFFPGATQANFVTISALLGSCDSIICADTGHINCHECASIENAGHKIVALPHHDGKITAEQIEGEVQAYYNSGEAEYLTRPALVYISFTTEYGTLYTKEEVTAISEVCHKYGMYLFVDGARMGYGLGAAENDLTLADFARLSDAFYIGGTKCGALFGEAVVLTHPKKEWRFKAHMKQSGAVLAKGWILGLQFYTLLHDGTYFAITRRADEYALQIRDAFRKKGIPELVASPTNQQFVILTQRQAAALSEKYVFEEEGPVDDDRLCVRFCTSWSTKQEEVDQLVGDILSL
ncbi:low specificity L-threonine aldolase [uncultured Megasphaera sp.]|uniref:threonine aldolase family protein n=1 Tax=uncultured Megasphaera sp. TaxID=165188 RepID=UPI0025F037BC|nr:aminotransferase class I/II-fold pyridoxal phosphate-dependent enzyme [uncultured Megasphaera sp.]